MTTLFDSLRIKGLTVRNRIALPPLVRFGWSDDDGMMSDLHLRHYERIAKAGTGLIIVEATCVSKAGRLSDDQLGLWEDGQVLGLRELDARCKAHGAVTLVQIHHGGFRRVEGSINDLSAKDLVAIKDQFVASCRRAKEAGFDGVELHGAHGYLFSQFTNPLNNERTDEYGGDLAGRCRFPLEVVEAVAPLADQEFIIAYRMGCNIPDLDAGAWLAQQLAGRGVELLHVSNNGGGSPDLPVPPEGFEWSQLVWCGSEIRRRVNVPVIVVGGIRTFEQAEAILAAVLADFVAVGKGHLADPDWALAAKGEAELVACQECNRCQWFRTPERCPARKAAVAAGDTFV
jgi:NADPH2 dehydrogenase